MFRITLLIFILVGLPMVTPLLIKHNNDTCRNFTGDQCNTKENSDGAIEIVPIESVQQCQDLCKMVHSESCNFFTYDFRQEQCQIWESEIPDFLYGCKKIAGPVSPSVNECNGNDEPGDLCDVSNMKQKI